MEERTGAEAADGGGVTLLRGFKQHAIVRVRRGHATQKSPSSAGFSEGCCKSLQRGAGKAGVRCGPRENA